MTLTDWADISSDSVRVVDLQISKQQQLALLFSVQCGSSREYGVGKSYSLIVCHQIPTYIRTCMYTLICQEWWGVGSGGVWGVVGCLGSGGVSGVVVCREWWCVGSGGVSGVVVPREWWCVGSGGVSGVVVCREWWCVGSGGVSVCREWWCLGSGGASGVVVPREWWGVGGGRGVSGVRSGHV